jgi:hypothetical protein
VTNVGSWGNVYVAHWCDGGAHWDLLLRPGESSRGKIINADAVYVGVGQRVHRYIKVNGWVTRLPDLYGPVFWCTRNVESRDVYVYRF